MSIDWTKPLELMDGTPVRLQTVKELDGLYSSNPDDDGDYWIIGMNGERLRGVMHCQDPDTDEVRNRAETGKARTDAKPRKAVPGKARPCGVKIGKGSKVAPKTLRDEFAMAALTGILASGVNLVDWAGDTPGRRAFAIADAMMAARQGGAA